MKVMVSKLSGIPSFPGMTSVGLFLYIYTHYGFIICFVMYPYLLLLTFECSSEVLPAQLWCGSFRLNT